MKTYSDKPREHKNQAAANNSGGKRSNSVPALQPKLSETGKSYPTVIQRYITLEEGGKLSEGKRLFWQDAYTLYAGEEQFEQANNIPNSAVEFMAGEPHAQYGSLFRVITRAKEGSDLYTDTLPEKYNEKADLELQHIKSLQNLAGGLYNEFIQIHKSDLKRLKEKDRLQRENELELAAKKTAKERYDESEILFRLKTYLQNNEDLLERPLMPSDCHIMSTYIAGFNAAAGKANAGIAPGNVYEIMPHKEDSDSSDSDIDSDEEFGYDEKKSTSEWESHYATIIMTDGPDHVTMENAGAKESEQYPKKIYDHTWMFKMYGPENGQGFFDEYAEPLGHDPQVYRPPSDFLKERR